MKVYDSLIIGGGPAGVTAALYLLRSGAEIAWAEKLSPGGQVLMTEVIENYPGFPRGIKGWELADTFAAHLEGFTFDKFTDEVLAIEPAPLAHRVLVGETWITARTVIICSGARYRKLGVPGEDRLIGRGVSFCALCDGNFFRGQDVACIGGGNTALEESLYLARLVNRLHLVHRRDAFRGCRVYQDKVNACAKIEPILESVCTEILGDDKVTGIRVKNVTTGEVSTVPVDGVFIFVGQEPQAEFLPEGLEKDSGGFIVTDCEMRTNIPGIFAAGDVRSKHVRQVATAVGDGATAATNAFSYLEKENA